MAADGFVSLTRPDAGFNLVFLRTGLPLAAAGVRFTTPIETEDWGERYFQVTDPNGVVIQLVQWMTDPAG